MMAEDPNEFKEEFTDVTPDSAHGDIIERMVAAYLAREPDIKPRYHRKKQKL